MTARAGETPAQRITRLERDLAETRRTLAISEVRARTAEDAARLARRETIIERVLGARPHLEPLREFLTGADEDEIRRQAAILDRGIRAPGN